MILKKCVFVGQNLVPRRQNVGKHDRLNLFVSACPTKCFTDAKLNSQLFSVDLPYFAPEQRLLAPILEPEVGRGISIVGQGQCLRDEHLGGMAPVPCTLYSNFKI